MADDTFAPLVADRAPLNAVKWAARDYPSVFDELLRRLKALYGTVYNDYATTTQGIMLVEMMAYATAQVLWNLDRVASDCFLETARTPTAVSRIVKQLGYKMRPAAAASTTLRLTFTDGTAAPFTMPARWRYQGPNGLVYESYAPLAEAAPLAAGATRDVAVRQGETRILTFTGTGKANQVYQLSGVPDGRWVAAESAEVWVDGLEWAERAFLTYAADEQFEVDYAEAPPRLRFGDGIAGLAPPLGAEVKVRFVIIDGAKGNEPKAHSIATSIDVLTIGGAAVTVAVDNAAAPSGGADPETADHARRLAPLSFAARGAAITGPDYEALSNSFVDPLYGAVAKAYAFNPRGTYSDLTFNSMVESIEALLDAYVATAGALEDLIAAGAADLSPLVTVITDAMNTLEALRAALVTSVGSAKAAAQGAQVNATTAESAATTINDTAAVQEVQLTDLYAYVDANTMGAVRTHILEEILDLQEQNTTMAAKGAAALAEVQTIAAALSTVVGFCNEALNKLTNAAPIAPDASILQVIGDVTAAAGDISTTVAEMAVNATDLVGDAAALQAAIINVLADMRERIGFLFADDCLSNYVQVPILALDADGNYVAPSVGLVNGLQVYLDGIKEVTQQVEVIDGSPALVPATFAVALRVGPAYIYEEEEAKVRAAVVALLKGRSFNQPLYLSALYDAVKQASVGVAYVNISIASPTAELDSEGNLVPDENKIITLAAGGLTITRLYA